MLRPSLLLIASLVVTLVQAQSANDSISIGPNYSQSSYYSLSNGEVSNADNTDWDIAFNVTLFSSTIRTNGGNGTELYLYPNGTVADWATLDTAGLSTWPVQYNSDTSWTYGAFDRHQDGLDVGWGIYNTITHTVTGDSLFVIKLSTGDWKKVWIEELAGATIYTFRYADLDGSNEVIETLEKANFSGKHFAYYSLQSGSTMDLEPALEDWDIVFTKYISELSPSVFYGVTGALSNNGVAVAQAYPVNDPFNYYDVAAHDNLNGINGIGHDWKYFDMGTFEYLVEDSLCYFVTDLGGNIWRLTFTSFEGSTTGKIVFNKELVSAVGIDETTEQALDLVLYPNPASGSVEILYNAKGSSAEVAVYDVSGKKLLSETYLGPGFNVNTLSLNDLSAGVYVVTLSTGNAVATQRLVIQ